MSSNNEPTAARPADAMADLNPYLTEDQLRRDDTETANRLNFERDQQIEEDYAAYVAQMERDEARKHWQSEREHRPKEDRLAERTHSGAFPPREAVQALKRKLAEFPRPGHAPEWPGSKEEASDGESPWHKAGHDFSMRPYEAAILALLLNNPREARMLLRNMSPEHFYDPHNLELFACILRVYNSGQKISVAAVLEHLRQMIDPEIGDWETYVTQIAAVASRLKDARKYKRALVRATEIRGGGSYAVHGFREEIYAELLRSRLLLVRTFGEQWFEYRDGCWTAGQRDYYRKAALNCLHPRLRRHKSAMQLVGHVEAAVQTRSGEMNGAYKMAEDSILINVADCVVQVLPSGEILRRCHSHEYGFTSKLHAKYDPDADSARFTQLLKEALPDPNDQLLLQRYCGYILEPSSAREVCLVCFGPGGTGKSTVADGIRFALGGDVCSHVSMEALCAGGYPVAGLGHKILNVGSELRASEFADSSILKALISGEPVEARKIYCAPETMRTTVKLMFLSNNMPRFRSGSTAELRRLRFLYFPHKPDDVDVDLKSKLQAESSGILNWMLEGLVTLRATGAMPFGGTGAQLVLKSFASSNDPVGQFLVECCEFDGRREVNKDVLFTGYMTWCSSNGIVMNENARSFFYRTLRERHPELTYPRRTFKGARADDDPEKRRMVAGIRIRKQLKDETITEAIESKKELMGHRAYQVEPPGIPA